MFASVTQGGHDQACKHRPQAHCCMPNLAQIRSLPCCRFCSGSAMLTVSSLSCTTASTIVQAVVKASSQNNGNGQISTPWMKTPLGTEANLGSGHIVLDGVPAPANGAQHPRPLFGPCLLWPRSPISATAELLLLYSRERVSPHWWTDFDHLYVI